MALLKCPDCGSGVSNLAPSCPSCGRPVAAIESPVMRREIDLATERDQRGTPKSVKATIAAIGVLLVVAFCFAPSRNSGASGDASQQGESRILTGYDGYMKEHNTGCVTRAAIERVVQLAGEHDDVAFARFVSDPSNGCREMNGHIVVEDVAVFSGLAQVRLDGETRSYWTMRSMIR